VYGKFELVSLCLGVLCPGVGEYPVSNPRLPPEKVQLESSRPDCMFWVYVLQSETTGRSQIGSFEDLANRFRSGWSPSSSQ